MYKLMLTILFIICNLYSSGIIYKDTMYVPVTFYDHKTTTPVWDYCINYTEFNMGPVRSTSEPVKGMVKDRLDSERKPVFNPVIVKNEPSCNRNMPGYCDGCGWFNKNIYTWFRPQQQDGVQVSVIKKNLKFIHKKHGMYEFYDWNFYPLDGDIESLVSKGIEKPNSKTGHNMGFCLHYQDKIVYDKNKAHEQIFTFMGDDDVWVFIDNRLILDLGGIHYVSESSFNMEDIAKKLGLKSNESYNFDFFYCERREVESHIRITTNLDLFSYKLKYYLIK
jgi:fibro-slime domain-containing protein